MQLQILFGGILRLFLTLIIINFNINLSIIEKLFISYCSQLLSFTESLFCTCRYLGLYKHIFHISANDDVTHSKASHTKGAYHAYIAATLTI